MRLINDWTGLSRDPGRDSVPKAYLTPSVHFQPLVQGKAKVVEERTRLEKEREMDRSDPEGRKRLQKYRPRPVSYLQCRC